MYESHAAELRAQVARQSQELADYETSIGAATAELDAATSAIQPHSDRVVQLEKEIAEQKAIIEAAQPAINAARAVLDGLQTNAEAIRKSIATCNELLKQPIEPDPKPVNLIPQRVPTAALLIVIERRKLTAQLDAILAALPEEQQREFGLYLKMPYTRRDHPLVAMVQQAFGWTDGEVDALFVEADQV